MAANSCYRDEISVLPPSAINQSCVKGITAEMGGGRRGGTLVFSPKQSSGGKYEQIEICALSLAGKCSRIIGVRLAWICEKKFVKNQLILSF